MPRHSPEAASTRKSGTHRPVFRRHLIYFFWILRFRAEWWRAALLALLIPAGKASQEAPFFIVGCGRSGNTVLRRMLCENYDVAIPPENPFVYGMLKRIVLARGTRRVDAGLGYLRDELAKPRERLLPDGTYYAIDKLAEYMLDFDAVAAGLRQQKHPSPAQIFSAVYKENAKRQQRRTWGDKTPVMAFNYRLIRKLYPNARFIFMVRDPVDCAASYLSRMNVPIERTAARWRIASWAAEEIRRAKPDSILTIRYEDMVSDPVTCRLRLERFLTLLPLAKEKPAYIFGDDKLAHHEKSKSALNRDSLGGGKGMLSPDEMKFLRYHLAKVGNSCNYSI